MNVLSLICLAESSCVLKGLKSVLDSTEMELKSSVHGMLKLLTVCVLTQTYNQSLVLGSELS